MGNKKKAHTEDGAVVVVAVGGLANRMRAICSGVALAGVTGRKCVVKWENNADLKADYNVLFENNNLPFSISPISSALDRFKYGIPRKKNFYLPHMFQCGRFNPRVYDSINMAHYIDNPEALVADIKKSKKSAMIYSGLEFFNFDKEDFRKTFRFTKEVLRRADEIGSGFDYGCHIRRTDNMISIKESPIDLFEERILHLIEENPEVKIFIASDSQEVKEGLAIKFPKNVSYNPSVAARDSERGMIDAAAEMYLLSKTKKIFGSYWSSFSEAAAILGEIPFEICRK